MSSLTPGPWTLASQRGVNLIELIFAIVIISIACIGVLLVYAQTTRFSADPMILQQAVAVGQGYLDEILARPAVGPDGSAGGGEPRALYDGIDDYAGLSESPPRDQTGAAVDIAPADGQADLTGYGVDVAVTPNVGVGGVAMTQVDVRVRYPPVVDVTLTGYRAE